MLTHTLSLLVTSSWLLVVGGLPATPPPAWRRAAEGGRSSEVEWSGYSERETEGPGTYAFGYDVEDAPTGNVQFRSEQRHPNGSVTGSYGFLDADGVVHVTHYVADAAGFRSMMETITSKTNHIFGPVEFYGGYYDNPGPPSSGVSMEAQSAAVALREFKKQSVHEQRTRPKDKDRGYYQPEYTQHEFKPYKNYRLS